MKDNGDGGDYDRYKRRQVVLAGQVLDLLDGGLEVLAEEEDMLITSLKFSYKGMFSWLLIVNLDHEGQPMVCFVSGASPSACLVSLKHAWGVAGVQVKSDKFALERMKKQNVAKTKGG